MWRKIDMHNLGDMRSLIYVHESMCRHAVDRSQGGLVEINIWHFGTDDLLNYIADRSSNLKSLRLAMCNQITDEGVTEAVVKLPFLKELDISFCTYFGEYLRVVGQSCPNLKTLKLNCSPGFDWNLFTPKSNTIVIAESMPKLRYLQLFGNEINNTGLNAILDGCPHLEHLDLRTCFNIYLVGDLEKRCSEKIRVLKRPYDSTADFAFENTWFLECYSYSGSGSDDITDMDDDYDEDSAVDYV